MKTQAFPCAEIAPNTYEIGEFDCGSIFLLVGDKKAMLIDTGTGIGDLKGFIRTLTDKPLMVCYTHNHVDHVGGAGAFDNAHIHPADMEKFSTGGGIGLSLESRRGYVNYIAQREKGIYPYNLDEDLTEWGPQPPLYPLEDGQVIDLGNRKVTVYECPGHTPGSVVLLDEKTRILFLGDACNPNLLLAWNRPDKPGFTSIEKALGYLKRLYEMRNRYDCYYNGHYDFRPFGKPLGEDVMPDVITAYEQIVAGTAEVYLKPAMFNPEVKEHAVKIGRCVVSFNPEGVHEPR